MNNPKNYTPILLPFIFLATVWIIDARSDNIKRQIADNNQKIVVEYVFCDDYC